MVSIIKHLEKPNQHNQNQQIKKADDIDNVWKKIEINIMGPFPTTTEGDNKFIITCVDCFSLWPEAAAARSIMPQEVAQFLINLISRYGFPEQLCTPTLGEMFLNRTLKCLGSFLQQQNLPIIVPWSFPSTGRSDVIESSLNKLVSENPCDWDTLLNAALVPLRMTSAIPNKASPFYAFHNRMPHLPFTISNSAEESNNSLIKTSLENCQEFASAATKAYISLGHGLGHKVISEDNGPNKQRKRGRPKKVPHLHSPESPEVNLKAMKLYLEEGTFTKGYSSLKAQITLKNRSEFFKMKDGKLYIKAEGDQSVDKEVLLNHADIKETLKDAHNAGDRHYSEAEMTQHLVKYYWCTMDKDIKQFVDNCQQCPSSASCLDDLQERDETTHDESTTTQSSRRMSKRITKTQVGHMKNLIKLISRDEDDDGEPKVKRLKKQKDQKYVKHDCDDSFQKESKLVVQQTETIDGKSKTSEKPQGEKLQKKSTDMAVNNEDKGTQSGWRKGKQKAMTCKTCDQVFYGQVVYDQHVASHTGQLPYPCDVCGKCFKERRYVSIHKRLHTGIKPYKCEKCEKAFCRVGQLNTHRYSHDVIKRYGCDHCPKSFATRVELKNHIKIHFNEKPHKCPHCPKMFKRKGDIHRHKIVHFKSKPYQCSKCMKAFARAENLRDHMNHHSGKTPYKCKKCPKAFRYRSGLRYHIKAGHDKCQVKCITQKEFNDELYNISESTLDSLTTIIGGDRQKVEEIIRNGQAFIVRNIDDDIEYQIVCADEVHDVTQEEFSAINVMANVTTNIQQPTVSSKTNVK